MHLVNSLYFPESLDHRVDRLRIGRKFFVPFVGFNCGVDRKRTMTPADPPIVGHHHAGKRMPELREPDQSFAKRGRVEVQDRCTKRIGPRYAGRDCQERGVFGGLTTRGVRKHARLRGSHYKRAEGFESLHFRMAFQDPVDGRIAFDPPFAHESETDGRFGLSCVQERLPDAANQFSKWFFLAGSEGMVRGYTHGSPNIG